MDTKSRVRRELHKWVGGARVGDTGGWWQSLGAFISRYPPLHLWWGMGVSQELSMRVTFWGPLYFECLRDEVRL